MHQVHTTKQGRAVLTPTLTASARARINRLLPVQFLWRTFGLAGCLTLRPASRFITLTAELCGSSFVAKAQAIALSMPQFAIGYALGVGVKTGGQLQNENHF